MLARTDPQAARTYDPAAQPEAKVFDSVIALTNGQGVRGFFNRDHLATAYLLLLEYPDAPTAVKRILVHDFGLPNLEAVRHTLAAKVCIDHNIEP